MLSRPNILACVDFSEKSLNVIAAADKLSRLSDGNLTVLHCGEPQVFWDWMLEENTGLTQIEFQQKAKAELSNKLLNVLAASKVNAIAQIELDFPERKIQSVLKEKKIDLLVIGHNRHAGNILTLGSVAAKLVSNADIPVLVVKNNFDVYKVGALLDPGKDMEKIISAGEELAYLLGVPLECVSVFPDITAKFYGLGKFGVSSALLSLTKEQSEKLILSATEKIRTYLSRYADAEIAVEINDNKKIHEGLLRIMDRDKINLAVMARHQSDVLEKFLIGSETRRMMELFPGNLFILPPILK